MAVCCEQLLTAKEVASRSRVHLRTFYRWCALGLGPAHVLLGRSRRYRESDVAKWMERHAKEDHDQRRP